MPATSGQSRHWLCSMLTMRGTGLGLTWRISALCWDHREWVAKGSRAALEIVSMRTEDDTMRALAMISGLGRLCDKLQLFAARLLTDSWLNTNNNRSFQRYRDRAYMHIYVHQ